jgi:hypothetical protein
MSAAEKICFSESDDFVNQDCNVRYSYLRNNVVYRFDYLNETSDCENHKKFTQSLSLPNNWWYNGMNNEEKIIPLDSSEEKDFSVINHPCSWSIESGDYVRELMREDDVPPRISNDRLYIRSFIMVYMFIASLILIVQTLLK